MSDSLQPHGLAPHQASLSITNSQSLFKLMSIESVMPSSPLILCRPLLLLPSIFPSIRVFSNESVLRIKWPKYWSFSFNISPSNEYSGLISFRMDWFDLLAVQGTPKSPPIPQLKSINSFGAIANVDIYHLVTLCRASEVVPVVKNPPARRHGFNPWVTKIPWRRRAWQPTLIFLPEESLWTEEPGRLRPWGHRVRCK